MLFRSAALSVDIAHYVRLVMASRVTVGFGQLCPAQGARPLASCCCFPVTICGVSDCCWVIMAMGCVWVTLGLGSYY